MALDSHLAELSEKHRQLQLRIEEEMNRPAADDGKIRLWKREKLKLKDLIAKLEAKRRSH